MGVRSVTGLATGGMAIDYPESDGKPMAETDLHRDEMFDLIARLRERYVSVSDVYVSGNLLLYYEEGNPHASVAPDVFVVRGVAKQLRRVYKLWQEGIPPLLVIEVTSRKTRREDLNKKKALYAKLGVAEYVLYDPEAEYLSPPLQGYRWVDGEYEPLSPSTDGSLRSERLQLDLILENGRLELYDAMSGDRLPRLGEMARAERRRADAERMRADAERERADAAEAELARLVARLREETGD